MLAKPEDMTTIDDVTSVRRPVQTGFVCSLVLFASMHMARSGEPLRTAAGVLGLPPEQARTHREVKLTGVITFAWHSGTTDITVQDETGAVWLPPIPLPANCTVGTKVEIVGHTEAGAFGPIVQAEVVRPLGPEKLPEPQEVTYEELLTAGHEGQRVALTGVVRGQRVNPEIGLEWLALEIATGGGRVTVNVTHEITGHPELLDARVRVCGVNLLDAQQQAFLPMINAHTLADVKVISPAGQKPFEQPPVALNQIMRNANPAEAGHRIHMRGTVTATRSRDSFFLQDETRGLQVFLREPPYPEVGESVDVVGFPEPGAFSPVVRDADWRPSSQGTSPEPLPVSTTEAVMNDGRLVTVQGRLVSLTTADNETLLTLEEGRVRYHARIPGSGNWRAGSELQITGVCSVEIGDWELMVTRRPPQSFSLLARGPGDVRVIRSAPFWTVTRVAWALVALAAALGGTLGYVWLQSRGRLREAARSREAAHSQFEAVLGERARMAREIHDTLAQGFAGISVQLEVLNDRLIAIPEDMRRHLGIARSLVRDSLDEARRSVWNLRSQTLEENGLPGALGRLGHQLTEGSRVAFALRVHGVPRTLPAGVENNLLRIGQEVMTNAIRHSGASRLSLDLVFHPDHVRLEVKDNGRGFDPAGIHASPRGGFGLAGLRERATEMHARLEIHSTPGGGTKIEILVPHV